jgi:hypothetical protein
MYFRIKNILKNNRNYTPKHPLMPCLFPGIHFPGNHFPYFPMFDNYKEN